MSRRVLIAAAAEDAALAGLSGSFEWGEAAAADAVEPSDGDVVVRLGRAPAPARAAVELDWADDRPEGDGALAISVGGGPDRWRTTPWPAADALFKLPPPGAAAGVVLAGLSPLRERDLLRQLEEAGVETRAAERLDAEALGGAAAVVLGGAEGRPLPARAMAVLAAGRVLVTARAEPAFGLQPGIEYVAASTGAEAGRLAGVAVRHPEALRPVRALGRLAAERHRASRVYATLLRDLELERLIAPAEAPRRLPSGR